MPDAPPSPTRPNTRYPVSKRVAVYLTACVAIMPLPSAFAQDQPAGKTAAVNTTARGTPPSSPTRVLLVGQNVFQQERVQTDGGGQVQMLFVDGTTLTIGPNSDFVLDDFVYDPASGTGRLAATMSAGLLRFVGGRISKSSPVNIKTPAGEVAVRGGVMLLSVDGNTGSTSATLLYGRDLRLTGSDGSSEVITRPGFSSTVARGAVPSPAVLVTTITLQQMTKLEGTAHTSGGASTRPSDAAAVSAPLNATLTKMSTADGEQSAVRQQVKGVQVAPWDQAIDTAIAQITANNAAIALAAMTRTQRMVGAACQAGSLIHC
jgi:trimeric autotransporter adhesin